MHAHVFTKVIYTVGCGALNEMHAKMDKNTSEAKKNLYLFISMHFKMQLI